MSEVLEWIYQKHEPCSESWEAKSGIFRACVFKRGMRVEIQACIRIEFEGLLNIRQQSWTCTTVEEARVWCEERFRLWQEAQKK